MPITGPSSYVPTAEEFDQHWATADASLGPGNEITLPDGAIQAGLTAKKDQLADKRAELQGKLNNKEIARGDVEIKKAALLSTIIGVCERSRADALHDRRSAIEHTKRMQATRTLDASLPS